MFTVKNIKGDEGMGLHTRVWAQLWFEMWGCGLNYGERVCVLILKYSTKHTQKSQAPNEACQQMFYILYPYSKYT